MRPARRAARPRSRRALHEVAELEFWNAGGSGSVEATAADPAVTEVAAGSGLLVPGLFDHYRSLRRRARRRSSGCRSSAAPPPAIATVAGGGLVASRADRRGPRPRPVGAARPAPDRARGRRRGADPADRPRRAALLDRRPGVVPAREVRRARRAHQHACTCCAATRSSRRCRPTAAPATPGDRQVAAATVARRSALAARRRRSAPAGWSASTGRPGRARRRWPRRSRLAARRRRRCCTWTTCSTAGTACRRVDDQLDTVLAPLRRGRPGSYRRYDWHGRRVRRDRGRRPGAAAGGRGRRRRARRATPTASPAGLGRDARPTCGWRGGWSATARRCARDWEQWAAERRCSPASAPASEPTSSSTVRPARSGRAVGGPAGLDLEPGSAGRSRGHRSGSPSRRRGPPRRSRPRRSAPARVAARRPGPAAVPPATPTLAT